MSFHVGQKVVCIHSNLTWRQRLRAFIFPIPGGLPIVGKVYTVANVYAGNVLMLELFELPAPESNGWLAGFRATCFRPVVTRSTKAGMAILRQILADHKAPVREKV